jgi:hypothetical protein
MFIANRQENVREENKMRKRSVLFSSLTFSCLFGFSSMFWSVLEQMKTGSARDRASGKGSYRSPGL